MRLIIVLLFTQLSIFSTSSSFATVPETKPPSILETPTQQPQKRRIRGTGICGFLCKYGPRIYHDIYEGLAEVHENLGRDGSLISLDMPFGKKMIVLSDPDHITEMARFEAKGQLVEKGFSTKFVTRYLLEESFASMESTPLWQELHNLISPHLAHNKIPDYYKAVRKWAQEYLAIMGKMAGESISIDVERQSTMFAMGAVTRSMFNYPLSLDEADNLADALSKILQFVSYQQTSLMPMPPWVPIAVNTNYKSAHSYFLNFIEKLQNHDSGDSLAQTFKNYTFDKNNMARDKALRRGQFINIFFGGHETTAHWIAMSLYFFQNDSEFANRLVQEVDLLDDDYVGSLFDDKKTKYLTAFVKEVLRVDPSVPVFSRDTVADITIEDNLIPKGTTVLIYPYGTHRLEGNKFFKSPNVFDPDNFLINEHNTKSRSHNLFAPFGFGTRKCIGKYFAEQEVKIFLVEYIRQKKFRYKYEGTTTPCSAIVCTARINGGLPMLMEVVE